MKASILILSMLLSIGVAYGQGGEGNNTGCNGVGNANSPCDGGDGGGGTTGAGGGDIIGGAGGGGGAGGLGGAGGAGGLGGTGIGIGASIVNVDNGFTISPRNTNTNLNNNRNDNENNSNAGAISGSLSGATGGNATGGSANAAGGEGGSASSKSQVIISTTNNGSDLSKRVPNAYAPPTGNSNNAFSCLKGASGAGSGAGFGLSFGGYMMDDNCDARVTSDLLWNYGMQEHSIQVLCAVDSMREADATIAKANNTVPQCIQNRGKNSSTASSNRTKVSSNNEVWSDL